MSVRDDTCIDGFPKWQCVRVRRSEWDGGLIRHYFGSGEDSYRESVRHGYGSGLAM